MTSLSYQDVTTVYLIHDVPTILLYVQGTPNTHPLRNTITQNAHTLPFHNQCTVQHIKQGTPFTHQLSSQYPPRSPKLCMPGHMDPNLCNTPSLLSQLPCHFSANATKQLEHTHRSIPQGGNTPTQSQLHTMFTSLQATTTAIFYLATQYLTTRNIPSLLVSHTVHDIQLTQQCMHHPTISCNGIHSITWDLHSTTLAAQHIVVIPLASHQHHRCTNTLTFMRPAYILTLVGTSTHCT